MGSVAFLLSRKMLNRIKEAFHKPAELILIVLFVFLMGFTVFAGNIEGSTAALRDINELYAIILALYTLIFILTSKSGFVNGASMFSMADVNLIFTGPKKQSSVLFYGLLSQLGRSLLLGFFILYQYTWLHDSYGIGFGVLVIILVGYGVTVFLSQMLAMLIYSVISGSDRKNNILKTVYWLVIGAFFAYLISKAYLAGGDLLENIVETANSAVMKFFPVAGFVQMGVVGAVSKNYLSLFISLACFALFCVLYFVLISVINADYYEDVLKATEVSFSAITARKEGKAVEAAPRNVKVGKTGFKKGEGASAIAQKHKIENRRSKFFILDTMGIVMAAITIAVGYFSKNAIIALAFDVYIMIFTVSTGRWAKELSLPYIYLIPEPPFRKLLHTLREQFPSLILQSAIIFGVLCCFIEMTIPEAVTFALAKVSFGFLFIGVNLLVSRLLGNSGNKTFIIFVYFFIAFVFAIPGIVSAFIAYSMFFTGIWLAVAIMSLINIVVSLVLVFLCRNILEYAQYNNR